MLNLDNLPYVKKLGDTHKTFLQVLVTKFTLTKTKKGFILKIDITDDNFCITSSPSKKKIHEHIVQQKNDELRLITEQIEHFMNNPNLLSYRFNTAGAPFRFANGGVLPIIRIGPVDYFCLFYRTIFPVGWNIANGASNNLDELLSPEHVVYREFSEELFISDDNKKLLYIFDSDDENVMKGTQSRALKIWGDKVNHLNLNEYEKLSTPLKWIGGPDSIHLYVNDKKHFSSGYFINITPKDNAIEMDKIAYIKLNENISLFDGEVETYYDKNKGKEVDIIINRVIGLFSVNDLIEKAKHNKNRYFIPDIIFFNGKKHDPKHLKRILYNEYFPSVKELPTVIPEEYKKEENKFDLCPITREIVNRYIELLEDDDSKITFDKKKKIDTSKYQVFMSCKSIDAHTARSLYEYLTENGLNVFCCYVSLGDLRESEYAHAIDRALETSDCMIVIGSKAESFSSGWVAYEWRSFFSEIHSGRKIGGKLFTFTSGVDIHELPYALRYVQNIPYSSTNLYESFENLLKFTKNTLHQRDIRYGALHTES